MVFNFSKTRRKQTTDRANFKILPFFEMKAMHGDSGGCNGSSINISKKKQPNGCAKPVSALLLSFNSNALIIGIQNKANELFGPHEQKVTQCESFYERTTTMFTTFQSGKNAILCTPLFE